MCRGLAIIAERVNDQWTVYALQGEHSHDRLLHTLRDDLRLGRAPHLKFEMLYPRALYCDIYQPAARDPQGYPGVYPPDWLIEEHGKFLAVPEAYRAVESYLDANPELRKLTHEQMQGADLSGAKLEKVQWPNASLSRADLSRADLRGAVLSDAVLRGADLRGAVLSDAVLRGAVLSDAVLSDADLRGAVLSPSVWGNTILPDGSAWTPETDMTKYGCIVDPKPSKEALIV